MNLKTPSLFNLLFWAAMGLFILYTYTCSELYNPLGHTEITPVSQDVSCTEGWFKLGYANAASNFIRSLTHSNYAVFRSNSFKEPVLLFEDNVITLKKSMFILINKIEAVGKPKKII
ncbi:MAG: hypothetical protein L6Q47_13105 [Ignavibacteriaceae bacterium]|nr:hypothetical protein [Ignavibacteriaceae bacterium]